MQNIIKTALRILAAVAITAAVSACSPSGTALSSSSFPVYSSQASAGQYVAPSIMDY